MHGDAPREARSSSIALSIILPVLNEAAILGETLDALASARAQGCEVVAVDGGSSDGTLGAMDGRVDVALSAPRGRASQMNTGARAARGEVLLFLHADTRLPPGGHDRVLRELARTGRDWGRFDVEIRGASRMLAVVAWTMNLRSRLSGIATGDQAMFVRRSAFLEAGGFPAIALMEDIALSARLKRRSAPLCLREKASTSGRRWEKNGVLRTILLMWYLRSRYFLGADPDALARRYYSA